MTVLEAMNQYYGYEAKSIVEFIQDFQEDHDTPNEAIDSLTNFLVHLDGKGTYEAS